METALEQTAVRGSWMRMLAERAAAWARGRVAAPRHLQHVETLTLGPKRAVFLVECDGQRFLVAAGGDGMSAPVLVSNAMAEEQR